MKIDKYIFSVLITAVIFSCTPGPKTVGPGMNYFNGTFDQALVEAAKQNKPIFIYCYTDWCGYCKKMEKSTFKEKDVNDFMNKNYISLSYDMEKGEGVYIGSKYGIRSFPAYVKLDPSGQLKEITLGYLNAERFMDWVKISL